MTPRQVEHVLLSAIAAVAMNACAAQPADIEPESDGFLIRNVRIFDGERVIPETEILVEDGLIAAIGESGELPTTVTEIDGLGQTLLPGLIDSHTHIPLPQQMRQAAVFGVTTQLDMFTSPERVAAAKDYLRTEAGGQAADLFSATSLVAPGLPTPTFTGPEQAQSLVDQRIAEGADYIKIYSRISDLVVVPYR